MWSGVLSLPVFWVDCSVFLFILPVFKHFYPFFNISAVFVIEQDNKICCTVKPRYNAVSGRHLLRPRYKRGAL